jgi:hypothetical protein
MLENDPGSRREPALNSAALSFLIFAMPAPKKKPGAEKLTLRDLNRALLARQLLLAREKIGIVAAVRQLAGLQAQWPAPPYVGLWTRLAAFDRTDLVRAIEQRALVRAPFLRATLHLVAADDFLRFRPVLQPVLDHGFAGRGERTEGIDPAALAAEARPFLLEAPRSQDEVRNFLVARHPKLDERMMGHAVRMTLPLVQVPGPGTWGFPPAPQFSPVEAWLGKPLTKTGSIADLVLRYLAAFGPAAPRDFQTWSGLPNSGATFETLRSKLAVFTDEKGRELFDLPDAPRPGGDVAAPPRFVAEYDNLLLAHTDRSRVVADEFRKSVFLPGLRVAATFLIDGFVRGAWKIERAGKKATLVITPFAALAKQERAALEAEGQRLLELVAFDADPKARSVRFAK